MKVIFVTWGVLSGIGKGITAASLWAILKGSGKKVFCQKFDGYLNVDPGTMSPFQHGEVFVTKDGAETDLDIGHYERFLDTNMNRFSSFTSGKLYEELIARERRGDFLWGTVQIVPHLTNLVKEKIQLGFENSGADISIVEIGGTVGDMENEYLLESARQLQHELWRENVCFLHVALLPYLGASKELKSKPIQHSIRTLMGYGISPDFLVVRADTDIPEEMMQKLSDASGIKRGHIFGAPTLESIYHVPLFFDKHMMGQKVLTQLGIHFDMLDMSVWKDFVSKMAKSETVKKIALIGKYTWLEDAYYSLNDGLKCAGFAHGIKIQLSFIEAETIEKEGTKILEGYDGICIPGGFGSRGIEGMILATEYARKNNIPYLGICLGSQIMAIEYARNVLGITDASSEEFEPDGENNVIHIMHDQKHLETKWGNMRLWSYPCTLVPWSLAEKLYGTREITERHRHRFEFNNAYRTRLEEKGFLISGTSTDGNLVEVVEIKNHPFMIATQAHPELKSRPHRPHPLFVGFVEAMIK